MGFEDITTSLINFFTWKHPSVETIKILGKSSFESVDTPKPTYSPDRLISLILIAYVILVLISIILLNKVVKINIPGSINIALIIGLIFLNISYIPANLNLFSEFSSPIALYILAQIGTLFYVGVYSVVMASRQKVV